ncbi:MAG TPA: ferrochelatase [Planctomycetota bacterium]
MQPPLGILLVNLGTPAAPRPREVRAYLREFLSDPRVIDLPALPRWLLLNLVILPRRPKASAAAYAKIWTGAGSPLLVHSLAHAAAVQDRLPQARVQLAMRYGEPSIEAGLTALRAAGCERIAVLPLYPQYASSSGGSTLEAVYRHAAALWNVPSLEVLPPFFDTPGFLDAFAAVGAPVLAEFRPDFVLMSFHGLPERQIRKSDASGKHCFAGEDCCASIGPANRWCYRAQCFATARGLAERLGLGTGGWSVAFQSRLGRTPWIRPYTDHVLPELASAGKRRVAVMVPSFVADCLETLEEIGMRAREQFRAAGGEELTLVPSLNAHPAWADAVAAMFAPRLADAAG